MGAYDGSQSVVGVYFDSDGDEVNVSLTDDPEYYTSAWNEENGIIDVPYTEIPDIVSDFMDAYAIRGGDVPALLARLRDERDF